jgi:RES domain-containing protein
MILWRLSNYDSLSGEGGLYASNRWNTRGAGSLVYCAATPAGSLLEVMASLEIDLDDIPSTFQYLKILAADDISREEISLSSLPLDWEKDVAVTRRIGDDWLLSMRSSLLIVPSALVPETTNILINSRHPSSPSIVVEKIYPHSLDARLAAIIRSRS